ncbi:MAG: hypothetical protein AB1744_13405, partial [Candidatus Zixiibacteriota bacterium]
KKIEALLKRRGFSIVEPEEAAYKLSVEYETERQDRITAASYSRSIHYDRLVTGTAAGAGASSGLGVSVAAAVASAVQATSVTSGQVLDQVANYVHSISIQIENPSNELIWKGESTWDSYSVDIRDNFALAIQIMLRHFPTDTNHVPWVPEVKETHVRNFYRLECLDRWFTCPALPYRIYIEQKPFAYTNESRYYYSTFDLESIEDPRAFAAFIDLIQTAEYALPMGHNDWSDPLDVTLWKRVRLGGRYLLGASKTPENVLVELKGQPEGYETERCWIATNEEFSAFQSDLATWQRTLEEYYSVYK